jgi:uncharacterized protein (TIRG00374 family)
MKDKKKIAATVGKYALFLSITAVLLYFSFRDIKFSDLMAGLQSANYWWIALSMGAGLAAFVIRARRWQLIIHPLGYRPSLKNTYDAVMLTYLANFAMPRMGEVVRCGALRKTEKIPFESLFGTVVLERVFDLLCLILISLSVVLLRFDTFGRFIDTNIWQPLVQGVNVGNYALVGGGVGGLAVLVLLFAVFRKRMEKLPFVGKIKKLWNGLFDGLKAGFRLQQRREFFLQTALLWVAYWLQAYAVMLAMPETHALGAIDALFLMIIGGLGWVAPVQGGMGAYHFLISMTLYAMYAIPTSHGVVFATISHETQAIMMIVLGLLSWGAIMLNKKVKNE